MHCLSYDTRYVYKPPMWKICTGHYGTAASQMIFTCKNLHKQNVTVRYKQTCTILGQTKIITDIQ